MAESYGNAIFGEFFSLGEVVIFQVFLSVSLPSLSHIQVQTCYKSTATFQEHTVVFLLCCSCPPYLVKKDSLLVVFTGCTDHLNWAPVVDWLT